MVEPEVEVKRNVKGVAKPLPEVEVIAQ